MLKWLPVVDPELCTECGLCAAACGPMCLRMHGDAPVLVSPEACGSAEDCIGVCGDRAIRMAWVSSVGDPRRGKWKSELSSSDVAVVGMKNSRQAGSGAAERRSPLARRSVASGNFDHEGFLRDTGCFLFTLDSSGRFADIDRQGEEILGYPRRELMHRTIDELVVPRHRRAIRRLLRTRTPDSPVGAMRLEVVRKDGTRIPMGTRVHVDFREAKPFNLRFVMAVLDAEAEDRAERLRIERALSLLSARLLKTQDKERGRIARDLHDTTGQNLAALQFSLAGVQKAARALDSHTQQALGECIQLTRTCADEIRTLSYLLHPAPLKKMGLIPVLRGFVAGYAQRTGVQVDVDLPRQRTRMPWEIEAAVFRTVQEGLTNIHRHSGSRTAVLRLEIKSRSLVLELEDHGRGLPTKSRTAKTPAARIGVGIAGMRERARQLGGRLTVTSGPGGTTLRLVLPLAARDESLARKANA